MEHSRLEANGEISVENVEETSEQIAEQYAKALTPPLKLRTCTHVIMLSPEDYFGVFFRWPNGAPNVCQDIRVLVAMSGVLFSPK